MTPKQQAIRNNKSKAKWLYHEMLRKKVLVEDKDDLEVYLSIPDCCPVLGVPLLFSKPKRGDKDTYAVLYVLDPEVGPILANVQVVSYKAAKLLHNVNLEESLLLYNHLRLTEAA